MNAVDHIIKKYVLDREGKMPLAIRGWRQYFFPELFNDLGLKVGVEIGVEEGMFSEALLKRVDGITLHGVDPWLAYEGYREHVDQNKLDGFYQTTLERLKKYNFRPIRSFSHHAADLFPDESLDFVYIDGNHEFFFVVQDLHCWVPKVKKGGIVAGHDYRRNSHRYVNDVKDVIPGYMYAKKIKPWFVLEEKNAAASWFFVKE